MSFAFDSAMPRQETAETRAYKGYLKHIRNIQAGVASEEELAEWAEKNAEILELKDVRPNTVHHDEVLTNLSVMYANEEFIGLRIMPQIFTNGSLSAKYFEYNQENGFSYPDDTMGDGDRTDPNETNQGRSLKSIALTVRSLKEYLDQYTIQNQTAPLNEIIDVQTNVLNGMAFNRERRIITACTTDGSFGSNIITIAAGDQWHTSAGGDPGGVVDAAQKMLFTGTNATKRVAATSLDVYNVLKRHPRILDTFKFGTGELGAKFATPKMLAEYFEVDEFLVGRARKNNANEALTGSYGRMWPNVLGIFSVAQNPSVRSAAFGYTFQDMATQADLIFELATGAKGAYMSRATHADVSKVVCVPCGVLIKTPIG